MERKRYDNGIHDIGIDDYHGSEGISRSMLMHFMRSPYHYKSNLNQGPSEPTPALILGDLTHTMILEPHMTEEWFVVKPSCDRRTKAGKIDHERFMCGVQGRTVIDQQTLTLATDMGIAVRDNALASALIKDALIEQSIYFKHKYTGLQCKVRPDVWNNTLVVDLKTTKDASYSAFQHSAFNYGYFLQAAMINEALRSLNIEMEKFIFIAVENKQPNGVGIYELSDPDNEDSDFSGLAWGIEKFNSLMMSLAECIERESFPCYTYSRLELPFYARNITAGEIDHDE